MKESEIEEYLKHRVGGIGGQCWKRVSPGRLGVPDRILILPGGVIWFVETKAPGKTERPAQKYIQGILTTLGCMVWSSVDSREKVEGIIRRYEEVIKDAGI